MAIDNNAKTLSPKKLAHVVIQTNNFANMVEWYSKFLGAEVIFNDGTLAFLAYDDEHHRIALVNIPVIKAKDEMSCGLNHVAFTFDSLTELLTSYRQRKAHGINPFHSINHGPTTSIYYKDPDKNQLETQVDNYATNEEATAFMVSNEFKENPIGTDFDPEDFITRLANGTSELELKKRVEIGPRSFPLS
jgi:catechol-2,3-dioxygenase